MLPHDARALAGAALVAGVLLTGCGVRERGLADRCADVLRETWPRGVEVTSQQTNLDFAKDLTTATASVAGKALGLSGGAREVGIECAFRDNVLTGFRWTAGRGSGS
jgi:hypothetical protein